MTIISISIEKRNLFKRSRRTVSVKLPDLPFGIHERAEQDRLKETIWTLIKPLLNATQRTKQ